MRCLALIAALCLRAIFKTDPMCACCMQTLSEPLWALWPAFCGLQASNNSAAYGSDGAGSLALQLADAPPALTETAAGRQAWRKRQQQLLELRVGLARQLSSTMGLGAGAGAASGQQLLRAVGVAGPAVSRHCDA
jgi:hypothetical protein